MLCKNVLQENSLLSITRTYSLIYPLYAYFYYCVFVKQFPIDFRWKKKDKGNIFRENRVFLHEMSFSHTFLVVVFFYVKVKPHVSTVCKALKNASTAFKYFFAYIHTRNTKKKIAIFQIYD